MDWANHSGMVLNSSHLVGKEGGGYAMYFKATLTTCVNTFCPGLFHGGALTLC